MPTRFYSLFAALSLAVCLQAPEAAAAVNVTATQASGFRSQDVNVTLTVSSDGSPDEVDLSQISAYTFNLLWNPTVLDFNSASHVLPTPFSPMPGSLVSNWFDDPFDPFNPFPGPVDFSSGVNITASFHIRSDAAYGTHAIVFGDSLGKSILIDNSFFMFEFSGVTQGDPMQVTVMREQVPQIPEPAEISMLMSGLGVMALAMRRRKNRKP